jgi:pimeloyl-ACP methyl ester carboxylesterase
VASTATVDRRGAVQRIATQDGARLELLMAGPEVRSRPPVLLLHGAFAGAWVWAEHFMPLLAARGIRCYALSFRGHGGSAGRDRLHHVGLADYVADARAAIRVIGRAPVLVGHSLGALVAQLCLGLERLEGLALMAPVPPDGLLHPNLRLAFANPVLWIELAQIAGEDRPADGRLNPGLRRLLASEDMPPEIMDRYLGRMRGESRRALLEAHLPWAWRSAAPLGVPALVVGAERDAMIPRDAVGRTAWFHGAELQWVPDLAHALMLDLRWRDAADALFDWVAGKFGASA